MFADLHLHTRFSDGTYSPDELADEAVRHGLAGVSLTDHDTVEGCGWMAEACKARGLDFISGAELTAEINGIELHILGYGIDIGHGRLLSELARYQEVRQQRIRQMVEKLNQLGVPLAVEVVLEIANCRAPGRPHVARALVREGFCATSDEAFDRYLKMHRPAWVPKAKMSAQQAIELIHEAGGAAVLAHPGLNRVDSHLPTLAGYGLDGLECWHSRHSVHDQERYQQYATDLNLLKSGGSDCHGMNKGQPLIGTVKLPMDFMKALRRRSEWHRAHAGAAAVEGGTLAAAGTANPESGASPSPSTPLS